MKFHDPSLWVQFPPHPSPSQAGEQRVLLDVSVMSVLKRRQRESHLGYRKPFYEVFLIEESRVPVGFQGIKLNDVAGHQLRKRPFKFRC